MYSVFELIFPWTINIAFHFLKFNIGSSDPIYYLFNYLLKKVIVWANFALYSNCVRGKARPNIPYEGRRTSEDIQPRNG